MEHPVDARVERANHHRQRNISLHAAQQVANAAIEEAVRLGISVNAAVVDRAGTLIAFLRMPEASLHSVETAMDKAYTAASFGFSTKDWMPAIGHDEGMKFGFSARPRLIVFGGGLPIGQKDWIGGIGVSGASEAEDEECARAGLAAIGMS